jgi:hypothetical protein
MADLNLFGGGGKAITPVAVLFASYCMGLESPNMKLLLNVSVIVIGVVIASWGEIDFHLVGFTFQVLGICFEAVRLVMVQRILSAAECKMDPLVSLYYFAPICAVMNFFAFLVFESQAISLAAITNDAGLITLFLNALVAFGLNVAVVFLVNNPSTNKP